MIFMLVIRYIIDNFFFLLGYIGGANAFPRPLSSKEEKMYFDLYKKGDEDVKKYSSTCKDSDDLISIGAIGFIKAVTTYDVDKGHRFATYAARCVQNVMVTY